MEGQAQEAQALSRIALDLGRQTAETGGGGRHDGSVLCADVDIKSEARHRRGTNCRRAIALPVLILCSLMFAASSQAATRFASPNGTGAAGAGGCLEAAPCSLESAVENAAVANGDEVVLLPGPYDLGTATLSVTHGITIRPRDAGSRLTITGAATTIMVSVSAAAIIRDLKLVHSLSTGSGLAGTLQLSSPGAVAERLVVESTNGRPNFSSSLFACDVEDGTLRDSTCHVTATGTTGFGISAGTAAASGTHNPNFVNVTAMGTATGSAATSGLNVNANAANTVVTATARNVIAIRSGSASSVIAATTSMAGASATVTLTNSNFPDSAHVGTNATATLAGSATNQVAAPLLANPAGGDFHELAGSPTINAGAPDGLLGTQDFDFEARSQGGVPDIGADEFNVPATPSITATSPASPADNNSPSVLGTADATTTVSLYSNPDCSGTALGSGSAAAFAAPGIAISVGDNTTTELHALATDPRGHASGCSAAFNYVEITGSSQPPPPPPGGSDDTTAPETKIKLAPDRVVKTRKRKARFKIKFTANEDSTFVCELDHRKAKDCDSPFKGKVGAGFHLVEITATDQADNEELKPAKVKWRVKRIDNDG